MCTLTWKLEKLGYEVFFNRDELLTRQPEKAPSIKAIDGYDYIAPEDGDHQGTWLAVNAFGVTYALLNYYEKERAIIRHDHATRSRGILPQRMASVGSPEPGSLVATMGSLVGFNPFHLVAFVPRERPIYWVWDGEQVLAQFLCASDAPLTTSSFRSDEVVCARREAYLALGPEPDRDSLRAYHRSTSALGPAFGVRMKRNDAQTMSFSHIIVTELSVVYHYQIEPRDGCSGEVCEPVTLTRQRC